MRVSRTGGLGRMVRRNLLAAVGGLVVCGWVVAAVGAPWLAPYSPIQQNLRERLQPPGIRHLMGTDELGRDILSRVIYGSRISLPVGVVVVASSTAVGTVMGSVAGFWGGLWDAVLMRLTDLVMAFPPIILAMAVAAALGPGIHHAALALIVVSWPSYARIMRGLVRSVKSQEYVLAARALGASEGRILLRTVLPNCMGPAVVMATLELGRAILIFSGLSFLGLGAVPPAPEWGAMVAGGINAFDQWWVSGFPGLAIFSVVLAFNFLGDGLRDMLDPRLRGAP